VKNPRSDAKKFTNYKHTTTTTKKRKKEQQQNKQNKQNKSKVMGMLKPVQLVLSAGVVNSMQESFKF